MTQDRPLTGKQRVFLREYLSNGFNGVQAAKKAGYSGNTNTLAQRAHELVNKSKVKAEIDRIITEKTEKMDVTVEFIVSKLMKGLSLAESKQDLVAMARFSELLGKYKAMFTENVRTTTERQRELSEKEKVEAREIATIRLRAGA